MTDTSTPPPTGFLPYWLFFARPSPVPISQKGPKTLMPPLFRPVFSPYPARSNATTQPHRTSSDDSTPSPPPPKQRLSQDASSAPGTCYRPSSVSTPPTLSTTGACTRLGSGRILSRLRILASRPLYLGPRVGGGCWRRKSRLL